MTVLLDTSLKDSLHSPNAIHKIFQPNIAFQNKTTNLSIQSPYFKTKLSKQQTFYEQILYVFFFHFLLTAVFFETGAMPTPTKSQNLTNCG